MLTIMMMVAIMMMVVITMHDDHDHDDVYNNQPSLYTQKTSQIQERQKKREKIEMLLAVSISVTECQHTLSIEAVSNISDINVETPFS